MHARECVCGAHSLCCKLLFASEPGVELELKTKQNVPMEFNRTSCALWLFGSEAKL